MVVCLGPARFNADSEAANDFHTDIDHFLARSPTVVALIF
jgi:hypothetical protein